jgi:hypothetical protein
MKDIVLTVITADRSPGENYLAETLGNLSRSGVWADPSFYGMYIVSTSPETKWFARDVEDLMSVKLSIPVVPRLACVNAGEALLLGAASGADWVLFLEDDIDVCSDFLGSVNRWLDLYSQERNTLYAFGSAHFADGLADWVEISPGIFFGTQCFAIRATHAKELGFYLKSCPLTRLPGKYDLMIADWLGEEKILVSSPSFVQHIGRNSLIEPRPDVHIFKSWPGRNWRFR